MRPGLGTGIRCFLTNKCTDFNKKKYYEKIRKKIVRVIVMLKDEYSGTCAIRHLSFLTSDKNLWSQSISVN